MSTNLLAVFLLMGILCGSCATQDANPLSIWLYWGDNYDNHTMYELGNSLDLLNDPNYDANLPTVIYAHGWTESPNSRSTRTVVESYFNRGGWNTIVVNWQTLASPDYPTSARNVQYVGLYTGVALVGLISAGLPLDTLHIVGHSLGSHVAGHIGRNVIQFSNGTYTLPRISCLDPAGPLWNDPAYSPVTKNDAKFVDIIHTDINRSGASFAVGTVAFWPNGGAVQPGCPVPVVDGCNHYMSWRFWAESVESDDQNYSFLAVQAAGWNNFREGNTNDSVIIQMGLNCPPGSTGDWFLQTNPESPYSRSVEGITYIESTQYPALHITKVLGVFFKDWLYCQTKSFGICF